jgi:hypothetical protein
MFLVEPFPFGSDPLMLTQDTAGTSDYNLYSGYSNLSVEFRRFYQIKQEILFIEDGTTVRAFCQPPATNAGTL